MLLNVFVNMLAMTWTIEFYSETIQQDIMDLPKGLQARYIHMAKRMTVYGPNLKEPHTKALRDGLFEMRLKSQEGIARVFVLHGCRQADCDAAWVRQEVPTNAAERTGNSAKTHEGG